MLVKAELPCLNIVSPAVIEAGEHLPARRRTEDRRASRRSVQRPAAKEMTAGSAYACCGLMLAESVLGRIVDIYA